MSGKITEISQETKEKKKMIAFFCAIVLFCVVLAAFLYCVLDERIIGSVLFVIGVVGPGITFLGSLFVREIREWIVRWKIWSNPNFKWYIRAILLIDIIVSISIGLIIWGDKPETPPQPELYNDSIEAIELQRQFDELDNKFNYRIKDYPTFGDARQSLVKDSIVLAQIIQMLNENPELSLTSKDEYIIAFNERVDSVINIIKVAITDTILNYSEYEAMTDKYEPIIKEIEQMKSAL